MATCIKCNLYPAKKGRLTCIQCTPKENDPFIDSRTLRSEHNFDLICAINPKMRLAEKEVRKCQYYIGHEPCLSEDVEIISIKTFSGRTITRYLCPLHINKFIEEARIQFEQDKAAEQAEKIRLEENRKNWEAMLKQWNQLKR